jgi:hypothetical protein
MLRSLLGVSRLDQRFQHVKRDHLDAVADVNLWFFGKFSIVGRINFDALSARQPLPQLP